MSDWNPARVETEIYSCAQRIATGVMKADTAYKEFLKADRAFDLAYSKAFLTAEGSVDARKHHAVLATAGERDARDVADAAYKLMASNMKAIQSELDALRSIGTSVRQAYQVAGVGER